MAVREARHAVVGAGAWGTTLALLLSRRGPVTLLTRDAAQAEQLRGDGTNERHLPGAPLGDAILITSDPTALASATELVVLAVPSAVLRERVGDVAPSIATSAVLLSVVKGLRDLEPLRMSQVIAEEMPGGAARVAALSGPNLAPEIDTRPGGGAVVASPDDAVAAEWRRSSADGPSACTATAT